ncbi:glutamine--fructose-6-phosphate transaminase (isomerizing) [Candidatus Woesearchaeota archaeon]|nr:MAG: glutamine--fructose-6-phosphate transaminase (isomerizing) [Candidatus Woesearchaeota archaeon]
MCGITGIITKDDHSIKEDLLKTLKRLEYRGYDSVGFATNDGFFKKSTLPISDFINSVDSDLRSNISISHTRWATHGGVNENNAHPHFDKTQKVFCAHNGIIENFNDLKEELEDEGYSFKTETDSEIITNFFHKGMVKEGKSFEIIAKEFIKKVKGTFAILLIIGDGRLYALKRDSPLALGITEKGFILASDIYSFSNKTDKAIFFGDDEFAIIDKDKYAFFDKDGKNIDKEITSFEWSVEEEKLDEYPHYMIKEIKEQPITSRRLIESLKRDQANRLKEFENLIKDSKRVVFVASGTSYHASLVGVHLLNKQGIESHAVIASEFENFYLVDDKTLILAVSQSGETMDVVTVIKKARKNGAKIASIVNVPYSTIQRHSDTSIEILAGQEVCVASTKAFTNQLIALFSIARSFGYDNNLENIPDRIKETLDINEEIIKELAQKLYEKNDMFILGKGATYPIAREIALKLKEIPYVHAEGMMAGELKHGTIALIEDGTPVFCLVPGKNLEMLSSAKEVESRGAKTIIIGNKEGIEPDILLPESDEKEFSIYSSLIGHLLSYYIGVLRGVNIDKPRNLAKSVTVH